MSYECKWFFPERRIRATGDLILSLINLIFYFWGDFFALFYISITWKKKEWSKIFFLEPYEEKTSYTFLGGGYYSYNLSQWAVYRIVAIDVRSRREGRDLRKVGFYDPIKNQTYLNVPVILDFLERGAQPTGTVYDILKKAEILKELRPTETQLT